jgi:hypothetical protein
LTLLRVGIGFAAKVGILARIRVMRRVHNWRNKQKKTRGIDAGTGNGNRELVVVARNAGVN